MGLRAWEGSVSGGSLGLVLNIRRASCAERQPDCELQYILTSWMSLPQIRNALEDKVIPEGVWPNADERHQPWTLLAGPVAELEDQIRRRHRPPDRRDHDASVVLMDAWADALLSRPIARVFAETPSMLTDMFAFGRCLEESHFRGAG